MHRGRKRTNRIHRVEALIPSDLGAERGAVLIEGAIAGIVFMTILFAVLEFGLTFFDYITTSSATRNGAHEGSTAGNDPLADYNILQKIKLGTSTMPGADIRSIIIYKASAGNSTIPSACLTGPVSGTCNVYSGTDLSDPSSDFGCASGSPDKYWCPATRLVGASATGTPATGPPDYLGVYIQSDHTMLTQLFASSYTFSDKSMLQLEAQTP